jgi:hypothetical protein
MSSLAIVPVFYRDQDYSWMSPCREVSRDEARRLKQIGAGCFIEHGRAFWLHQLSPPPPIVYPPGPLETATTITLSEIHANCGITGGGERGTPADNRLVERAQHKIRSYPHIFDKLAVLARVRFVRKPSRIRPQVAIAVQG